VLPGLRQTARRLISVKSKLCLHEQQCGDTVLRYVKKLMTVLPIDSFGTCLHTADARIGGDRRSARWQQEKIELLGEYRFVLAFESSNVDNYVTEKVCVTRLMVS
jgi:hypothetical protein